MVFYCDLDCQKQDWKIAHSIECKLFADPQTASIAMVQLGGIGDDILKIIRIVSFLKLHKEKSAKKYQLVDGTSRCFNDLKDHYDGMEADELLKKTATSLASTLADSALFSPLECSYENILHMYSVWKTNAFGVSNEDDTKIIGSALYILSSSFDHSCRPNAIRVVDDSCRMQIRCIEAIPVGEAPKITYLAGIRNRVDRQNVLKKRYFFNCECSLCETEKDAPAVNFVELLGLRAVFDREGIYMNEQFVRAELILNQMQKIFCRYDERITNLYDLTLEKLVLGLTMHTSMVEVSKVKQFAKQVEENLRITFGVGHKDYKYLADEVLPRLNALNH
ncbi:N-lysine methyltransferase SMYD2-like [Bradysia coprophila]|uniref:N-lysine methyltransferase SMYD2-like n=1 Tax=Bradysia coprophila TaxID=38358 RepID=UPI00187DD62C|nr:N-lysine methyltransferase SMYD2-like [Bradysia coprophila]